MNKGDVYIIVNVKGWTNRPEELVGKKVVFQNNSLSEGIYFFVDFRNPNKCYRLTKENIQPASKLHKVLQ